MVVQMLRLLVKRHKNEDFQGSEDKAATKRNPKLMKMKLMRVIRVTSLIIIAAIGFVRYR